jgi:hypothetical protein
MAINLGQVKLDASKDQTNKLDTSVDTSSIYKPEAVLGEQLEKQKQKVAIHKEILRVSTEISKV